MDSPAAQAAIQVEAIKKIPLPTIETFEPPQLAAAAAAFAIAVRKVQEAEKAIQKIKADRLDRDKEIAKLQAIVDERENQIIDIWCADYFYEMEPPAEVNTMEVPGFFKNQPLLKTAVLYENTEAARTVAYYERSINIAPHGIGWPEHGDLVPAEALTAAGAFVNAALEPGHFKWRRIWRYGVLLTNQDHHVLTDRCTVQLIEDDARGFDLDSQAMSLDQSNGSPEILENVPISYPPCDGQVFEYGDEVLVLFEGVERDSPKVIGFRREPRPCPQVWEQITL